MSRASEAESEAADWLIAKADGPLTPDEQARFDAWWETDGNKAAYWRLEFGWEEAGRINALGPAMDDLAPRRSVPAMARRWAPAAIAASIVLVIGGQQFASRWFAPPLEPAPVGQITAASFSTALGEAEQVALTDGTRIDLNTQSKLRTRITPARREVWLDEGEAFFEVAHREDQPFLVHAGNRQITVLGTKFSVRRDGDTLTVAVLEGRVRLAELDGTHAVRSSIMVGGDIALASGSAALLTTRSEANVAQELSWREGMLAFDQEPLAAITAEFNRYNYRKLVLGEGPVGLIRISGTFPADDPDAFARLLGEAYGLNIAESESEIRIFR